MSLLLTREEVRPLLDLRRAIEVTESAFRQQAQGQVVAHAPYHIQLKERAALRVVSGALLGSERVGVRLGPNSGFSGGDRMCALLFDTESGELLTVMGYPFGTLRTAATVGLAARYLAREDARRIGLFGVGRNALGLLRGIALVRQVEEVLVFNRDAEKRRGFCEKASQTLEIDIRPAEEVKEAVRGMDIVLTATNVTSALFPEEWIEPGMHLSSMGKPAELSQGVFLKAHRVVVGSREHERLYHDRSAPLPLVELTDSGKLSWDGIWELGEVVVGRKAGRAGPGEITVFRESQGGFGDVALAAWVYDEARRSGLGREVTL